MGVHFASKCQATLKIPSSVFLGFATPSDAKHNPLFWPHQLCKTTIVSSGKAGIPNLIVHSEEWGPDIPYVKLQNIFRIFDPL